MSAIVAGVLSTAPTALKIINGGDLERPKWYPAAVKPRQSC